MLGQAGSRGQIPTPDKTYDAKSYESVQKASILPKKLLIKMSAFEKYCSNTMFRFSPVDAWELQSDFARDVGFVIDDKIINSNIIPDREDEKRPMRLFTIKLPIIKFTIFRNEHTSKEVMWFCTTMLFCRRLHGSDYPQLKQHVPTYMLLTF